MTIVFTGRSVGTVPTLLLNSVPAQGATLVITNGDASNSVFIGSGTAVTTSTGAVIPPYGIVTLRDSVSSSPLYAIAGTAVTVGVFYGDSA